MEPIHPMIVTIERAKRRFTSARGSRATTTRPRLKSTAQRVKVPIRRRSTTIQATARFSNDQRRNAATKAVTIEQYVSEAGWPSAVGDIVEITSGIWKVLVDGRWDDLMIKRKASTGSLEGSRG